MSRRSLPEILREDRQRVAVEGETYSANPADPFWRVRVRFTTGLPPSLERIRAKTASQALEFVCARYPFASRSGTEVLGRWDPNSSPVDAGAVRKATATVDATKRLVEPTVTRPPLPPLPKKQTMTLPTLKRLPRDAQGRAILREELFPGLVEAHDGGLSWPTIARQLGCAERNLRERVAKWKRLQGGAVPAAEPVGGMEGERKAFAQAPEAEVAEIAKPPQSVPEPAPTEPMPTPEAPQPEPDAAARVADGDHAWLPSSYRIDYQQGYKKGYGEGFRIGREKGIAEARLKLEPAQQTTTSAPVITPTKSGGFMVQVIVNPVDCAS